MGIALPIPEEAPVIQTTFSLVEFIMTVISLVTYWNYMCIDKSFYK